MTRQIRIESEQDVRKITDLIHDQYLDIEGLEFDEENSCLRLRYLIATGEFFGRLEFPAPECFLTIFNVVGYSVHDTEKVRYHPMNQVVFDHSLSTVQIKTSIPLGLSVSVTRFSITVQETDHVATA